MSVLWAAQQTVWEISDNNVPVGRCNIQTSYVGYNTNIFNEIPVTSSKGSIYGNPFG